MRRYINEQRQVASDVKRTSNKRTGTNHDPDVLADAPCTFLGEKVKPPLGISFFPSSLSRHVHIFAVGLSREGAARHSMGQKQFPELLSSLESYTYQVSRSVKMSERVVIGKYKPTETPLAFLFSKVKRVIVHFFKIARVGCQLIFQDDEGILHLFY